MLLSADSFLYAGRARVFTKFHENPYERAPATFTDNELHRYYDSPYLREVQSYGPLWTLISFVPAFVGGDNIAVVIVLFRFIAVIANFLALLLIMKLAIGATPVVRQHICALYALNPVFLLETANSAHNDIVMVLCGLLCLFLIGKNRFVVASIALVCGALIKYVYIAAFPLVLATAWRRGARLSQIFCALMVALGLIGFAAWIFGFSAGLVKGPAVIANYTIYLPSFFSPLIRVSELLKFFPWVRIFEKSLPVSLPIAVLGIGQLICLFIVARNLWWPKALPLSFSEIFKSIVLLGTPVLLPWYSVWFLPYEILSVSTVAVLFWTFASLLAYFLNYSATAGIVICAIALGIRTGIYKIFSVRTDRHRKIRR